MCIGHGCASFWKPRVQAGRTERKQLERQLSYAVTQPPLFPALRKGSGTYNPYPPTIGPVRTPSFTHLHGKHWAGVIEGLAEGGMTVTRYAHKRFVSPILRYGLSKKLKSQALSLQRWRRVEEALFPYLWMALRTFSPEKYRS